jgi:hypothetical protein
VLQYRPTDCSNVHRISINLQIPAEQFQNGLSDEQVSIPQLHILSADQRPVSGRTAKQAGDAR